MSQYSRRDFLTHSAAGALALASHGILTSAAFAAEPAEMAIAKWSGPTDLNPQQLKEAAVKLTENAIQAIGGLKRFIGNGSVVWIKPNIGWDRKPELAANTNPDVVATLIRLCFDAGAKTVKVGDNSCNIAGQGLCRPAASPRRKEPSAPKSFSSTRAGSKRRISRASGSRASPSIRTILDCDLVINVPVIKHHKMSELTMCMKNYMGVVEKSAHIPPGLRHLPDRHHPIYEAADQRTGRGSRS